MMIGAVYGEGRQRIVDVVSGLTDEEANVPVPACPGWTVIDVLAHVTGVCADILAGNLDGVATDPWTEVQVAARRGRTIDDLVAEWSETAPQCEAMAEHFPERAAVQWVTDLTSHEHDIRGATMQSGGRDTAAVEVGLDFVLTAGVNGSISTHGLAPLEVHAGDRSWTVGPPDIVCDATLEGSAFELLRAFTGRRSITQLRRLNWSVDPEPYLPAFAYGPFTVSPIDINE